MDIRNWVERKLLTLLRMYSVLRKNVPTLAWPVCINLEIIYIKKSSLGDFETSSIVAIKVFPPLYDQSSNLRMGPGPSGYEPGLSKATPYIMMK